MILRFERRIKALNKAWPRYRITGCISFLRYYDESKIITTEEGELIWLTADEIRNEQLFPSVKLVINHMLNAEKGTVFTTLEYDDKKQNVIKHPVNFCVLE